MAMFTVHSDTSSISQKIFVLTGQINLSINGDLDNKTSFVVSFLDVCDGGNR